MKKLLLMSKNYTTKDGRKFKKFFTHINIEVEGKETLGKQKKSISVVFGKDVDTKLLVRGILEVEDKDIRLPYKWKVTTDESGKLKFPVIKIYRYVSYEERFPESTGEFDLEDEADEEFEEVK